MLLIGYGPDNNASSSSTGNNDPIIKKIDPTHSNITKLREPLDDKNWTVWRDRIYRVFLYCGVDCCINGDLKRPDPAISDPDTVSNWDANDLYAQILITNNISKEQMVHVTRLATSCEIWNGLAVIHDTKDYRIAIAIQRALFRQSVSDGRDMVEHLTQLKHQWERLNVLDDRDFHITDKQFKTIIASSLPETWDIFTEPYVGGHIGTVESDPKKLMSSQEFIGILKEEYIQRKNRGETTQYAHYTNTGNNNRSPRPLANRIQNPKMASTGMFCNNCQQTSHITDDCKWLGKPRCGKCTWFGHGLRLSPWTETEECLGRWTEEEVMRGKDLHCDRGWDWRTRNSFCCYR